MKAAKGSTRLAQEHWNETPLFYSEEERYAMYPWLYETAEFRRHAGERVLEIGCGTGSDLLQFAKHGAIATGVDVTDAHLELARQRLQGRAEVQKADATALPFPEASFDYVYSHGVLHHIDRPELAVREILRVLKPGGGFNVHVYARYSLTTFSGYLRHGTAFKRRIENSEVPVHIELYTGRRLRSLFAPHQITISKHAITRRVPAVLERYLGWYLVAKGKKGQ